MKKSIIAAGAASIALAAMPVVSTFAETTSIKDNLNLTVSSTCSIVRNAHADSTAGSSYDGTYSDSSDPESTDGTYAMELAAGESGTFGMSTFGVTCNDQEKGYSLAAVATGLSSTSSAAATAHPINYYGAGEVSAANPGWNVTIAKSNESTLPAFNTTTIPASGGNVGIAQIATKANIFDNSKVAAITSDTATFTATYKAAVNTTQPSGLYTGNVTYTLTFNAD